MGSVVIRGSERLDLFRILYARPLDMSQVVLDIIDADDACSRSLTQLLEMNLPGGVETSLSGAKRLLFLLFQLQWRSPPPESDGFVTHLMSIDGGKASVSSCPRCELPWSCY